MLTPLQGRTRRRLHRAGRAARRVRRRAAAARARVARRGQDHDHARDSASGGRRRLPRLPTSCPPDPHARLAQGPTPTSTRPRLTGSWRLAARAAFERRDPRARAGLRGGDRRGVDADDVRAQPAAAGAGSAGGLLAWRRRRFVLDPRPLPEPADAATRCCRATWARSARRASVTWWPGPVWRSVTSPMRSSGWRRSPTATRAARSCSTSPAGRCRRPARACRCASSPRWDQTLLAYADRDRIIRPSCAPLKLTHSGDQTVTVDGRVAACWRWSAAPAPSSWSSSRTWRSAARPTRRSAQRPSGPRASPSPRPSASTWLAYSAVPGRVVSSIR